MVQGDSSNFLQNDGGNTGCTISGGSDNSIAPGIPYATISGGANNTCNSAGDFIGGGTGNTCLADNSVVCGGVGNSSGATGNNCFVGGGNLNQADVIDSSVVGGIFNRLLQNNSSGVNNGRSFIGGGAFNLIQGGISSLITGGQSNSINTTNSTGGGGGISIVGGVFNNITTSFTGQGAGCGGNSNSLGSLGPFEGSWAFGRSNDINASHAMCFGDNGLITTTGTSATISGGLGNRANGFASTIGGGGIGGGAAGAGGRGHQAIGGYSTIGGGGGPLDTDRNFAGGEASTIGGGRGNTGAGDFSSIGGGSINRATATHCVVCGGGSNTSSDIFCFVGGGTGNTASADFATVCGGQRNQASGFSSFVGGGGSFSGGNTASASASVVCGGGDNIASGITSFIGGGNANRAMGDNSTIAGGEGHTASGAGAAICGGADNLASADNTFVGGGSSNAATGSHSVVAGGEDNFAGGDHAVVGGGEDNVASGAFSTIAGGGGPIAGQPNRARGVASTIGGGHGNTANSDESTIGGGNDNIVDGIRSTISGGSDNTIGASLDANTCFIGGGLLNAIPNDGGILTSSSIIGGSFNRITSNSGGNGNIICGGQNQAGIALNNHIDGTTGGTKLNAFIGTGSRNLIHTSSASPAILNGQDNLIMNTAQTYNLIGNGNTNVIGGSSPAAPAFTRNTILNGTTNRIDNRSEQCTIINGTSNRTFQASFSTIASGISNVMGSPLLAFPVTNSCITAGGSIDMTAGLPFLNGAHDSNTAISQNLLFTQAYRTPNVRILAPSGTTPTTGATGGDHILVVDSSTAAPFTIPLPGNPVPDGYVYWIKDIAASGTAGGVSVTAHISGQVIANDPAGGGGVSPPAATVPVILGPTGGQSVRLVHSVMGIGATPAWLVMAS
jgi:hypothetical protein